MGGPFPARQLRIASGQRAEYSNSKYNFRKENQKEMTSIWQI